MAAQLSRVVVSTLGTIEHDILGEILRCKIIDPCTAVQHKTLEEADIFRLGDLFVTNHHLVAARIRRFLQVGNAEFLVTQGKATAASFQK